MSARKHTAATLALCTEEAAEANRKGRQDHGARWGRDILPCSTPCKLCLAKEHRR